MCLKEFMNNRVLHIISHSGLGGAQSLVKDLCQNTDNNFIYVLRKTKINIFGELGNKVFYYNSSRSHKFNIKILFDLKKIIFDNNFNILHLHLTKPLLYAFFLKLFYFPDIKIIYHEHGLLMAGDHSGKRPFWYVTFLNIFGTKVDKFIAISKAIENLLIKETRIPKEKVVLLYNFINLKKFNRKKVAWDIKKEKEKLGIKKDDFVIGFAGRLIERKGWKEFIESAKILCRKFPNFKFLIVGNGTDRVKVIDYITQSELSKNILYLGHVSNMMGFYSLLDCFVVPSHWEPQGLTVMEAQAMEIPIIASNVPALNEIVEHKKNGLIFKTGDAADLAEQIKHIFENRSLGSLLVRNGLVSCADYSLSIYTKKLNNIYKKL